MTTNNNNIEYMGSGSDYTGSSSEYTGSGSDYTGAVSNELLLYNISLLTSYPIAHYSQLLYENDILRKTNMEVTIESNTIRNKNIKLVNEKKRLRDVNEKLEIDNAELEIENAELASDYRQLKKKLGCCDEKSVDKSNGNLVNQYVSMKYIKRPESYSDEEVRNVLKTITSLESILQLKDKWMEIRHNTILQKLHNIIPAIEKLIAMVGLADVKKEVFKKIVYYVKNSSLDEYLHTQISGPPGVGKTEFAKIYADIFVRLGILKTSNFIEIKRDDLVGKYLGQTAPKTRELLEKAMGGVLFLDEAYSLGNEEKRDSFSKEAIDMINQYLSERKHDFMFIIAGYEDDLENCFFGYNKGLKRRFSSSYNIKGYDALELKEIFLQKVDKKYTISIALNVLDEFFEKNKDCFKYYGGDIEKFYNEIKYSSCFRTFLDNSTEMDIIIEDLENALKIFNIKKEEYRPCINMYI
jgi:SpoVK/Ycf46/Vps4 family AAA+-type ATPase